MAIYLKYSDVAGDVTEADHVDWVECDSATFGVSRSLSTKPGQGKDRESSAPVIGELTLTTKMDKTSPRFFELACAGKGEDAKIHFVQTTAAGVETYMEYTLTNTLIGNYSVSSQGDRPVETISLNFTRIEMTYKTYDEGHVTSGSVTGHYDLAQARLQ